MYLEHYHLSQAPFADHPDPETYFHGTRQEEVCQSLILDILAGRELLTLTGEEGTGKTLLCRLIKERLPSDINVILVDEPVASFDELLRILCFQLGAFPHQEASSNVPAEECARLMAKHCGVRGKTVLIIDGADKFFLALLERLVRCLDDQDPALNITLLLAGGPQLLETLKQLPCIGAAGAEKAGYVLGNLSRIETNQYLRFRLNAAGMDRDQQEAIFPLGVMERIFEDSQGNPRRINGLAEEVLRGSCEEKSFMVLLDQVVPDAVEEPVYRQSPADRIVDLYETLRFNRPLALAMAGCALLMFVIGYLLSGPSGPSSPVSPSAREGSAPHAAAGSPPVAATGKSRPPIPADRDGEQLLRERIAAGAPWLAGLSSSGYTIQLMILAAPQAQGSLTDMLVQDDYWRIRDQLYVLRKNTSPPTLFVFYGTFESLEAAREARNNMPAFLRRHQPYPLSISEAMSKIRR